MKAFIEDIEAFGGNSDRLMTSQLAGLSESQRGELALEVSLTDSAARRIAELGKNFVQAPLVPEIGISSIISGRAEKRNAERAVAEQAARTNHAAMVGVALLSAALAGGSAYLFARGRDAPAADAPAATSASSSTTDSGRIAALVQIVPSDALVVTSDGAVPVVNGSATLRGQVGHSLNVTVQRGGASKTFAVSLGRDGIASPARLVLAP